MAAFAALLSFVLGFIIITLTATSQDPPPPALTPPDGNIPLLSFVGRGVQIYECTHQNHNGQHSYVSTGAESELYSYNSARLGMSRSKKRWGYHYFLPHPDGEGGKPTFCLFSSPSDGHSLSDIPSSTATFKLVAIVAAADPTNIPSLLLQATSHSGNGPLSTAAYVQRVNTIGGAAPAHRCGNHGALIRVPYKAQYQFWTQAQIPPPSTPAIIMVPKGHKLLISFFGSGFQMYRYDGYKWVLYNVSATLSSLPGTPSMGKHYLMEGLNGQLHPTWEFFSPHGHVSAKLIEKVQKMPNDIPWLLLETTTTVGNQSLASMVTYVQRLSTVGGKAPPLESITELGAVFQSPYSAIYSFYGS